jgi:hypothetical protein
MTKAGHPSTLSVPDHSELSIGTLKKLIRLAEITNEEFNEALNK